VSRSPPARKRDHQASRQHRHAQARRIAAVCQLLDLRGSPAAAERHLSFSSRKLPTSFDQRDLGHAAETVARALAKFLGLARMTTWKSPLGRFRTKIGA
jgi:hypothetical protein